MEAEFRGARHVVSYDVSQGPLTRTVKESERQMFGELALFGLDVKEAREWFVLGQLTSSDERIAVKALSNAVRAVRLVPPDLEGAQELLDSVAAHCAEAPVNHDPRAYIPTLN